MTDTRRLLHGLSGIVGDLYGSAAPAKSAVSAPNAVSSVPAVLPFDKLWHTADETIDWTDILVSETPTDGLTPPETWHKLHALAPGVLQGDTTAYLDALTLLNPMADLPPYVSAWMCKPYPLMKCGPPSSSGMT